MNRMKLTVIILVLAVVCLTKGWADKETDGSKFYSSLLGNLKFTKGTLPTDTGNFRYKNWWRFPALRPYVLLDNGGEAYISFDRRVARNDLSDLSLVARTSATGMLSVL